MRNSTNSNWWRTAEIKWWAIIVIHQSSLNSSQTLSKCFLWMLMTRNLHSSDVWVCVSERTNAHAAREQYSMTRSPDPKREIKCLIKMHLPGSSHVCEKRRRRLTKHGLRWMMDSCVLHTHTHTRQHICKLIIWVSFDLKPLMPHANYQKHRRNRCCFCCWRSWARMLVLMRCVYWMPRSEFYSKISKRILLFTISQRLSSTRHTVNFTSTARCSAPRVI